MPLYIYGPLTLYNPQPQIPLSNITDINISGSGIYQTGTAITNGVSYNIYAFTSSTTTPNIPLNTITYSCASTTQCFVLAVAGGGGGGGYTGGGGGAGGVVMTPVILYSGTNQTITLAAGAGGDGTAADSYAQSGYNTIINFSNANKSNITALGGGGGGSRTFTTTGSGASSGGGSYWGTSVGTSISSNMNFGNTGAIVCGGGGGAGTPGTNGAKNSTAGNGGTGIQCFLPGIKDYTITSAKYTSGILISNLYWGGGGGGSVNVNAPINNSMGGLGGGGGGGITNSSTGNYGKGGLGLNDGGDGSINNGIGGNGGINTGGGGGAGGNASSSPGGSGGSGIVIIALPSDIVFANSDSVLTNSAFSTSAYNSICGAYGCKLLNYNYYGPIFTLRSNTDTTGVNTKNFYSDTTGNNIGDGYLGSGTSLTSWLSSMGGLTTYAYVSKWYDQGMDSSFNCATQYTLNSQPAYELSNKNINFGYASGIVTPSSSYFNLPNGSMPYYGSNFTYFAKNNNLSSNSGGTFINTGTWGYNLFPRYVNSGGYNWYQLGLYASTNITTTTTVPATNTIIAMTIYFTGSSSNNIYGNIYTTSYTTPETSSNINIARPYSNINNSIGLAIGGNQPVNSQMYYIYVFSSALNNTDMQILSTT